MRSKSLPSQNSHLHKKQSLIIPVPHSLIPPLTHRHLFHWVLPFTVQTQTHLSHLPTVSPLTLAPQPNFHLPECPPSQQQQQSWRSVLPKTSSTLPFSFTSQSTATRLILTKSSRLTSKSWAIHVFPNQVYQASLSFFNDIWHWISFLNSLILVSALFLTFIFVTSL